MCYAFARNSPRVNAVGAEAEDGGAEDELKDGELEDGESEDESEAGDGLEDDNSKDDKSSESSCACCTLASSSLKVIVIYCSLSIGVAGSEDDSVDGGSEDSSGEGFLIGGSIRNGITDIIGASFGVIQQIGGAARIGVAGGAKFC
jgi:hypothetical protein